MKHLIILTLISFTLLACNNQPQTAGEANNQMDSATVEISYQPINSTEALIATALMAAPEESREGCTVKGWNADGEFVTLKEGDNEFICLTDDPNKEGFNAACYHKDLEPFMARGRALKAEGMDHGDIFNLREEEVKSGKLQMAPAGSTLHIYYGKEALYDPATGMVKGAKHRYVVYLPFATSESTGLPEVPKSDNHPWIMNPGTHRAHIMITPTY